MIDKLRLALQWLEDLINGEMIESRDYTKDYLGFNLISQKDLTFITGILQQVLTYRGITHLGVVDYMGEIMVARPKREVPR